MRKHLVTGGRKNFLLTEPGLCLGEAKVDATVKHKKNWLNFMKCCQHSKPLRRSDWSSCGRWALSLSRRLWIMLNCKNKKICFKGLNETVSVSERCLLKKNSLLLDVWCLDNNSASGKTCRLCSPSSHVSSGYEGWQSEMNTSSGERFILTINTLFL